MKRFYAVVAIVIGCGGASALHAAPFAKHARVDLRGIAVIFHVA